MDDNLRMHPTISDQPLPSDDEMKRREIENISRTTSHELARALLALPEGTLTFVAGSSGPYTWDYSLMSLPWHVDWAKEIRLSVGANDVTTAKPDGDGDAD